VVICVGFLLVLLVIGVLKMRDTPSTTKRRRNKKGAPEAGMEWDDAGMNITVNPLEDVEKSGIRQQPVEYTEDEESDAAESYREDDELTDDDDDAEEVLPHVPANGRKPGPNGLEWDDSTLANVAPRTYRV